jgi:hypothetical protein
LSVSCGCSFKRSVQARGLLPLARWCVGIRERE